MKPIIMPIKPYLILLFSLLTSGFCLGQLGLPEWPLATGYPQGGATEDISSTTEHQYIDWTSGVPVAVDIPGTGTNRIAPSQAGINGCNRIIFYCLHNGAFPASLSRLQLFMPDGTPINVTGGDMNANAGDDEIQVVRRPGTPNQWFVIYSLAPPSYHKHPGYQSSCLAYSLIEVSGNTATYVNSSVTGTPIQDRILTIGGTAYRYFQGKATSSTSFVGTHDVYAQRRTHDFGSTSVGTTFEIDKFVISTSTDIVHVASSPTVSGYSWKLIAAGSPIEIDPSGNQLAVMARSESNNQQKVYLFDISSGGTFTTSAPNTVAFSELLIDFDTPITVGSSAPSQYHAPSEFDVVSGTSYDWLRNMEKKISSIEFSTSGQYLYFTGGGHVTGGKGNLSYLGQIDLSTPGPDHITRLQVQTSDPANSYDITTGVGETWSSSDYTKLWRFKAISRIQNSYDGNMYFTKTYDSILYVIPNPNSPMPIDLVPYDVSLANSFYPNIMMNGYVIYMPDQIDGFDYSVSGYTQTSFLVSNKALCTCETLNIQIIDASDGSVWANYVIDECPMEIELCVEAGTEYDIVGSNGVSFEGGINLGNVLYPTGQNVFNFGNGGATSTIFNTPTNSVITADEVWEGKWYIPDGVVIIIDGATLDLTNVDLVFGDCSGIDFFNGALLRANNSVFRPCEVEGTWRGLYFSEDGPDHIVNECTFKNAEKALYFNKGADGVVTENLFSNCNVGVHVGLDKEFDHPISGNRFMTDAFYPTYHTCYIDTDPATTYGVMCSKSFILSEISQNEFIYSLQTDQNASYGIHVNSGSATISENVFTNYGNPITLVNTEAASYIDDNEIEINAQFVSGSGPLAAGISILNSGNALVVISNNELLNNTGADIFKDGIYVSRSNRVSVVANTIDGFNYSVRLSKTSSAEISGNTITRGKQTGIVAVIGSLESDHFITCNDISMELGTGKYGIRVRKGNHRTSITSNCIKDTRTAIAVEDPSALSNDIPYIRNNYLYNYTDHGIYSDGYIGNIGAVGDPGLNTLWSNDNSAVDIASIGTTIQVADNFGTFNISFPTVQVVSNNPYHSTASCGSQIYNMPSQGNLNTSFSCENTSALKSFLFDNNDYSVLRSDYRSLLLESGEQYNFIEFLLNSYENATATLMEELIGLSEITDTEASFIRHKFYFSRHDFASSRTALSAAIDLTAEQDEFKELCYIALDLAEYGNSCTSSQLSFLETISLGQGVNCNSARALLRSADFHPGYYLEDDNFGELSTDIDVIKIENEMELHVYPNPAEDLLYIELLGNVNETNFVNVMDITGHLVEVIPLSFASGKFQLDVSNLAIGCYLIELIDSVGSRKVSKFIKK